jgi:outer membrane lipoprotein-sorting protein
MGVQEKRYFELGISVRRLGAARPICLTQSKKANMNRTLIILAFFFLPAATQAQDMTALVMKVKAKLDQVNDYQADGKMKTDVAFIKAPIGKVKVYYKKPNKFKLKKDGGISLLPKGGVSVNMNSIFTTADFVALAAGDVLIDGVNTKVVKLLPTDENSDVVLTTMYIDETNLLVRKSTVTTKENGTYTIEMAYGKYIQYGLPDKVVFSFNTKDYSLPKGITLEFDDDKPADTKKLKNKKGRVEITYSNYIINQGIADTVFK